ncbi:MAG: LPD29 domain-containing protein [Planctomycetota bacterium]
MYGGKVGTIVAITSDRHNQNTCRIVWDSGSDTQVSERLVCNAIHWDVLDVVVDADAILDAIEANKQHDADVKAAEAATAKRREEERQQHIADNPHLTPLDDSNRRGGVDVAKNVRKALKKAFPGVKFRVRSNYSSVRVSWTDGPTRSDVAPYVERHKSGTFDGMTDCQGWDRDNTFGQVFGECRFASVTREFSDESREVVRGFLANEYNLSDPKPSDYIDGHVNISTAVSQILSTREIPVGDRVTGCVRTDQNAGFADDFSWQYAAVLGSDTPTEMDTPAIIESVTEPVQFDDVEKLAWL